MTEPFVNAEVDRTKSRWVAKVFKEFGRPKTTLRALFYFALSRAEPDYPICGGFVGEIRAMRPYHESDGEKLAKWSSKAQSLGILPADALLKDDPCEHLFIPDTIRLQSYRLEIWLNRSAFNPLLEPVCKRYGTVLVCTDGPSQKSIEQLFKRAATQTGISTTILCISDLSPEGLFFFNSLATAIDNCRSTDAPDIRVVRGALTPEQLLQWKIPMIPKRKEANRAQNMSRNETKEYEKILQAHGLDRGKMAELDALEVYYPKGIAGFCEDLLARYSVFNGQSGQQH